MPTKIEWVTRPGTTPESWNPISGCSPISEGCRNCWAERMARRLAGRYGYPEAPRHFDVTLRPDRLEQPLHWRKPRTVFVCAMSDLFHKDIPDQFLNEIWRVFRLTPRHTYLILTKRPQRMLDLMRQAEVWSKNWNFEFPLPNVHLGVTAENQATADERIPLLLRTPAAVRFVSVEPILEPVNLAKFLPTRLPNGNLIFSNREGIKPFVNWVIAGGESGPGARPMHPNWARDLRDQCKAAGVKFFFKQWGEWLGIDFTGSLGISGLPDWYRADGQSILVNKQPTDFGDGHGAVRVGKKAAGRLLDRREWNEFPS